MEHESQPSISADRSENEKTFSADSSSPESVTNIGDTTEVNVIYNSNPSKLYV